MKRSILTSFFFALLLLSVTFLRAAPLRLSVQSKGTNQVELTFGPVLTNSYYQILVRSNGPEGHWIKFAGYITQTNETVSIVNGLGAIPGLSLNTLTNWTFVAGRWDDTLGDELPPLYKELVLRVDPFSYADPYGNPAGDGWSNLRKMQNDMDPLASFPPPNPRFEVRYYDGKTNSHSGYAVLTWDLLGGPEPDYFLIERADRTLRRMTNGPPFMRRGMYPPYGSYPSNWLPNRLRNLGTNRPPNLASNRWGNFPTNRPFWPPPNARLPSGRPSISLEDLYTTGPFIEIARIPSQSGVKEYRYVDTNVDTLFQPQYRFESHNTPPFRARLDGVSTAQIRRTLIPAKAEKTTNGFEVSVPGPIPYALYLLLVRDKTDPQWRASGYFESGTNRSPIRLQVDKKGMMSQGQRPIAMPTVRFLPDVIKPEFAAGWGEDSDGDGLPDIYEVLVTHTAPDKADTGNMGVLDGFKEMAADGWSNLEKFRRRADPLKTSKPAPEITLIRPTGAEIFQALMPKTDLNCEVQLAIRTNSAANFQPLEQVPEMLSKVLNFRGQKEQKSFDVRVSWQFAGPKPNHGDPFGARGAPIWYDVVSPLIGRINLEIVTAFKTKLESNPPLSVNEASNIMAVTYRSYRENEMDKGLAMAEMMLITDNLAQDFYGKAIDVNGDPVTEASVTAHTAREEGRGESSKTQTDFHGFFEFTGLRGQAIDIAVEKTGFQIEGGRRNVNGPETSLTNRAIFRMRKLENPGK